MNISGKRLDKYVGRNLFSNHTKNQMNVCPSKKCHSMMQLCSSPWVKIYWINFASPPTFTFHRLSFWWRKLLTQAVISDFWNISGYMLKNWLEFFWSVTPWRRFTPKLLPENLLSKNWHITNEVKNCLVHYWKYHEQDDSAPAKNQ